MLTWLALLACGPAEVDGPAAPTTEVDLSESWPVQFATVDSWKAYQDEGWLALVGESNVRAAVEKAQKGPGAARAHTEAAAVFRMAALVSAYCLIETYSGERARDTDPVETAHLLTVSYAILGDLDEARKHAARLPANHAASTWHAPWKTWLDDEPVWPPDLDALPVELPEVAQGTWPQLPTGPSFEMPVGELTQPMGDPGALLRLARWHEAAARSTAPEEVVHAALDRYRLPAETWTPGETPLTMEFLYASDFLDPDDAAFLAAVSRDSGDSAGWEDRSLLAALTAQARNEAGVSAEVGVDLGRAVRAEILDRAQAGNDGTLERHHRMFADIAEVGLLRSLALVAEAEGRQGKSEGRREESGKLRLAAHDIDFDHTRSLPAAMSLAAWQASNGYAYRAQEVIEKHADRVPSLEIARYSVDVLALRLSLDGIQPGGQ